MKLQSLTDFVLEIEKEFIKPSKPFDKNYQFDSILKYANFLRQPLTLQMFIPVDKHGVILEDLKFCCSGSDCGCMGQPVNVGSQEEIDEYYEAKERVIFKNCEVKQVKDYYVVYFESRPIWVSWTERTVEMLVGFKLELSDSAIKQIGL